jgi:acyl-CoA dehydrogenase
MTLTLLFLALFVYAYLLYVGKGYWAWVGGSILLLVSAYNGGVVGTDSVDTIFTAIVALAVIFGVPAIRRAIISRFVLKLAAKALPTITETEDIALKAGTVWWEAELFSGRPRWRKLLDFKPKKLTKEEQAFLDGPTEKLCQMLDDNEIFAKRDLPKDVWDFMKKERFFGMVIPKKHGGLGFGALAHSAVVTKIASRSVTAAITVMVPNSLGPGELLVHYGTPAQRKHYLPRLAAGEEIPCFALTEPHAGSDAANGRSIGTVCKGMWEGKEVLGIKATFDKRYITLAPVATVVGLAFNLHDPEGLLGGKKGYLGITCALLPRSTPGLKIGDQHDPMGTPFKNGPVQGVDVFFPIDCIIGGKAGAGNGWRMLMEALAAGRGISLPSLSVGAAQLSARAIGAYAQVREQFGLPIGKFEGVSERVARIAGHAYFMNATRKLTCAAVDAGEKPAIVSAIAKGYLTEGLRLCVNDAMDVQAGASICRGPRNIFSYPYVPVPIAITVEGANILTRSLIIFGQGALRCHPFLLKETEAMMAGDIKAFDKAFFGHINHLFTNLARAKILGLTCARFAKAPVKGKSARAYQRIERFSAAYAVVADAALATLGGALKRKESLSGRFADGLSWLFIATAALKDHYDAGQPKEHQALVDWTVDHALHEVEQALQGILRNLPNRFVGTLLRVALFPYGTSEHGVSDKVAAKTANALMALDDKVRKDLSPDVFVPKAGTPGLAALEDTLAKVHAAHDVRQKLNKARRAKRIGKGTLLAQADAALKADIINKAEHKLIKAAADAVDDVVQVDSFSPADYKKRG